MSTDSGPISRCYFFIRNIAEHRAYNITDTHSVDRVCGRCYTFLNNRGFIMEVILREWFASDAPALAKILNDGEAHKFLSDLPLPYTAADAAWFINHCLNAPKDKTYQFAIVADGKLAGNISAERGAKNIQRLSAELGYYVARPLWGRGIATAAVKAIAKYIFENTDIVRLTAEVFAENAASARVLEKCGFRREGTLKSALVKYGKLHDAYIYALLKDETLQ